MSQSKCLFGLISASNRRPRQRWHLSEASGYLEWAHFCYSRITMRAQPLLFNSADSVEVAASASTTLQVAWGSGRAHRSIRVHRPRTCPIVLGLSAKENLLSFIRDKCLMPKRGTSHLLAKPVAYARPFLRSRLENGERQEFQVRLKSP